MPVGLIKILAEISERIYDKITDPPEGQANVAQWCKKELCWEGVKALKIPVQIPSDLMLAKEEQQYSKRQDKKDKKLLSGIEVQMFVVQAGTEIWKKIFEYYKKYSKTSSVTSTQMDILEKMSQGRLTPPSDKQSKILYQLYDKAEKEGVAFQENSVL